MNDTFGRKITPGQLPRPVRAYTARRIYERASLPPGSDRIQFCRVLTELMGCKDRSSGIGQNSLTALGYRSIPPEIFLYSINKRTLDLEYVGLPTRNGS